MPGPSALSGGSSLALALALALLATGCKCACDGEPGAGVSPSAPLASAIPIRDPDEFLKGDWKGEGVEDVPEKGREPFTALVRASTLTITPTEMIVVTSANPNTAMRRTWRITSNEQGVIHLETLFGRVKGAAILEATDQNTIRIRHDHELGFTVYKRAARR